MKDSIIAGTGNSQYLKTSLAEGTTWDDALAQLRAGTFPIDLNGINQAGFSLHDFIMKTLSGMATNYAYWQVMEYALNWYSKGVLTEEDLATVESWFAEPEPVPEECPEDEEKE